MKFNFYVNRKREVSAEGMYDISDTINHNKDSLNGYDNIEYFKKIANKAKKKIDKLIIKEANKGNYFAYHYFSFNYWKWWEKDYDGKIVETILRQYYTHKNFDVHQMFVIGPEILGGWLIHFHISWKKQNNNELL